MSCKDITQSQFNDHMMPIVHKTSKHYIKLRSSSLIGWVLCTINPSLNNKCADCDVD